MTYRRGNSLGGLIIGMVISIAFIVAAVIFGHANGPIKGGVTTTGKVVSWSTSHSSDGTTFAPVVQYQDSAGVEHTIESSISSGS